MSDTRTFTKQRSTNRWDTFTSEATTDDGRVWRWTSNGSVCPLDACDEYGIPCDREAQLTARNAETEVFLKDYRRRQRNRRVSAEEYCEMRSAFGRGTTVVNVISGRRIRL